ncbi:DUF4352 domain-containing protein [Streptosporangium carneum]|uniref:DUF4352 domain-containing protein n=1 Tax=Streptosporangium carneum TaxID=47481 RepID=A0A9W6I8Q6_9ACTN|nr:DUF4352 domain-containing protein [Streptosporangium carneum]GLK13268.1 hypothetical protein GCM10017600_66790 [Streptosporangium carneum]
MHGNQQPQQYGYAPSHPHTVIVQKRGGGCLRAVLIGAAVLAVLVVAGTLLGRGGGTSTGSGGTTTAQATDTSDQADKPVETDKPVEAEKPGIGDTVKDGKFSFKVTKVETGVKRVGGEYVGSDAQGQYVLVHITVKNIGDEAQLFSDSSQKLIDVKNREYDTDSGAAALNLKNSNAFLNTINPGNTVRGILLFDVPTSFKSKAVELHDSPFSDGVEVSLR